MTPKFDRLIESLDPCADQWADNMYDMACELLAKGTSPNEIMKTMRGYIGNRCPDPEDEINLFLKQIMDAVLDNPNCIHKPLPPDMPPLPPK